LLGAALAAALVLTACGGGGGGSGEAGVIEGGVPGVGQPQRGGSLVVQMTTEIYSHLNPLTSNDPILMGIVSGTVYEKLVEFKTGPDVNTLEVVPDLAESWDISPDGLTYTFHLRDDVRWQNIPPVNGRPFTADDVVATFRAAKEPPTLHYWMFAAVADVTAPDPHTAVFSLKEPFAPLLEYLAYHFNVVLPQEGIDGRFDLTQTAIGTGPFMIASHTPDVEWVLKRNPDYYIPDRPYLDEIRRPILSDTAAITAALRSGRLDIGSTSDVAVAEQLGEQGLNVVESPGAPISFYINPTREPFDDVRVRKAVMAAIDWEGMGENIRGRFNLTSLLRPDTSSAALTPDEVRALRPYDPEAARRLLAEAGLPDGFDTTLTVQRVDDEDVREAQWMQADLAEVGIRAEIEIVDAATGIERRRNHDFALTKALRGVHLPDQVWRDFSPDSIENYALIDDAQLNEMFARTRTETDPAARDEVYRQMQRHMESDIVQAFYPIQRYDYAVVSPRVQNLWPSSIYQGKRLSEVWVTE
jgi:peptide/nickel transport system substrate-binding protein